MYNCLTSKCLLEEVHYPIKFGDGGHESKSAGYRQQSNRNCCLAIRLEVQIWAFVHSSRP